MYVQNSINAQFLSKIRKDNLFPQHHLLSYLYRKPSRGETQQSLNEHFIHSPDLLQKVRISEIIWWHHVLNCQENTMNQTHNIDFQKNISPVAELH